MQVTADQRIKNTGNQYWCKPLPVLFVHRKQPPSIKSQLVQGSRSAMHYYYADTISSPQVQMKNVQLKLNQIKQTKNGCCQTLVSFAFFFRLKAGEHRGRRKKRRLHAWTTNVHFWSTGRVRIEGWGGHLYHSTFVFAGTKKHWLASSFLEQRHQFTLKAHTPLKATAQYPP